MSRHTPAIAPGAVLRGSGSGTACASSGGSFARGAHRGAKSAYDQDFPLAFGFAVAVVIAGLIFLAVKFPGPYLLAFAAYRLWRWRAIQRFEGAVWPLSQSQRG